MSEYSESVDEDVCKLAQKLERDMLGLYETPIISDQTLQRALGYGSLDALRQAIQRKNVPIPIFSLEKRRGKFALVKDVALHLARERCLSIENLKEEQSNKKKLKLKN